MGLYVIYDELAKKSAPVFMASSDALALRQFEAQRSEIPEVVWRDLRLYRVGWMDMQSMLITQANPSIIDAASVLEED